MYKLGKYIDILTILLVDKFVILLAVDILRATNILPSEFIY